MKRTLVFLSLALGTLPSLAQRSPYDRPDQRGRVPAEADPNSAQGRLSYIRQQLGGLKEDVTQLTKDFSSHLQNQGCKPSPEEAALAETLASTGESVDKLIKEAASHISEQRVFRAFQEVDYNAKDLLGLAAKAGYKQALSQPLGEINEHVENLAKEGFRNPRVKMEVVGQSGGLFGGGPLFRRDSEPEKPMIRSQHGQSQPQPQQPQTAHNSRPVPQPTGRPDPTSIPQRPIPRSFPDGQSQPQPQQPQPGATGNVIGDLLRTILRGSGR